MELFDYIKSQLPQMPNSAIMKQMGASEELINYVKETPWNTNLNVIGSITNSGGDGDTGEVWLVGDTGKVIQGMTAFALNNIDEVDHITELVTNGENYILFINGLELPYVVQMSDDAGFAWADSNTQENATVSVSAYENIGQVVAYATYIDPSTAPTSVEVSVKAK